MALKPPVKHVKTVEDLIFWFYAQLIARAAGFQDKWGFVTSRYKKLKSGEMKWSSTEDGKTLREILEEIVEDSVKEVLDVCENEVARVINLNVGR